MGLWRMWLIKNNYKKSLYVIKNVCILIIETNNTNIITTEMTNLTPLPKITKSEKVTIEERKLKKLFYGKDTLFYVISKDGYQIGSGFLKRSHAEEFVNSEIQFHL